MRHWRKLAEDPRYRRAQRRALIEGPHLLQAALEHGRTPLHVLATEKGAADMEIRKMLQRGAIRPVLLTEAALRFIADAETPQGVAAEIEVPDAPDTAEAPSVFLEGVQDPANVGAILRTAAAFGVRRGVLAPACADPWSGPIRGHGGLHRGPRWDAPRQGAIERLARLGVRRGRAGPYRRGLEQSPSKGHRPRSAGD